MTTFKIKVVSGGIVRQTFTVEAPNVQAVVLELNATLVDLTDNWAFVHYGPLSSASISW